VIRRAATLAGPTAEVEAIVAACSAVFEVR
jgi:hypothetical protein